MPRYTVNVTLEVPAWITVEADDERAAKDIAAESAAYEFDYDIHSADVEFNITPEVTAA